MKNKMKKVLGIILSLVLVLGLMPWTSLTAYAVDTDLTLDDLVRAVGNRTVFRTSSSGTYISVLSGVLRLDYADPNNNGQYQTYNAASLTYDSSEGKYYVAFNGWTPTYYLVLDNDNYITSFVGTERFIRILRHCHIRASARS